MRNALLAAMAACTLASAAQAEPQLITGAGEAPITRDADSVRAAAEEAAREDLVREFAGQVLGAERVRELRPDVVRRLATQIRSEMIVDRSATRQGQSYRVTVTARIDQAWFMSRLDDEGVQLSADVAGADLQPIFVMVDENTGPARDYDRPQQVVTEYDHSVGGSMNDQSSAGYAEKDNHARANKSDSASASRASGAAGYSDAYSSGAAQFRGAAASSSSTRSASASSHSEAGFAKNDVQAETHDDTHFYQKVTYQTSATTGPAQAGREALSSALRKYDVTMANSDIELSRYFKGAAPTYSGLKGSPNFSPFLTSLGQRGVAPFFLGGTLSVRDAGRDQATGRPMCSGQFVAAAYATSDSREITSSTPNATASGLTYEDCTNKLASTLAGLAAAEMGPEIQRFWRKQTRGQARVIAAATSGVADYSLTVNAAEVTMDMQADLLDALSTLPGVERQVFTGQSAHQVSFQVRYAGSTPLQMALYQKLRSRPGFQQMRPTVNGQSIVICLSACGAQ